MFAAKSDFNRLPYNLTGLDKVSAGTFDDFINYYEEKELRVLFGNLFYDALAANFPSIPALYAATTVYTIGQFVTFVNGNVADIYVCVADSTGNLPTNPAFWTVQPNHSALRWARLVYGDEYLYYDRPQKWYGMKRIIVPLIYQLYTRYTFDNQSGQGIVVAKNENSVTISPAVRIARAMNEYAELVAGDWPMVVDWSSVIWPELENSLFGYLYLDSETWDDLVVNQPGGSFKAYLAYSFVFPGFTNVYGL